MKKRAFLKTGLAAFTLPQIVMARKTRPMDRIAMSTVTFRFRFKQTSKDGSGDLVLTDIPAYYADRFKLTNIEFWSKHFESQDQAYLDELKREIARSKTKLINLQVDEKYNLANKNPEQRRLGIEACKRWLDITAYLGAPSMRVNSGHGDKAACIASLKELNAYAKSKGLVLLVENHGGLSGDPTQLVGLIDAVDDANLKVLADYANWPPQTDIYEALKIIMPRTYLVSAKTKEFNAQHEHTSFDFDRCTRIAEASGFKGIYSAEQWAAKNNPADFEQASDWMIEHLKAALG